MPIFYSSKLKPLFVINCAENRQKPPGIRVEDLSVFFVKIALGVYPHYGRSLGQRIGQNTCYNVLLGSSWALVLVNEIDKAPLYRQVMYMFRWLRSLHEV